MGFGVRRFFNVFGIGGLFFSGFDFKKFFWVVIFYEVLGFCGVIIFITRLKRNLLRLMIFMVRKIIFIVRMNDYYFINYKIIFRYIYVYYINKYVNCILIVLK